MMQVYLWEAQGARGVTDDLEKAVKRVADSLWAEEALAAVVEPAWFDDGVSTMDSGYLRPNGPYLTACLRGGRVVWSDHRVPAPRHEPLRPAS